MDNFTILRGCVNFTKFSKLSSVSFRRFIYLPEYQVLLGIVTAILIYNFFNLSLMEVYAGTHYRRMPNIPLIRELNGRMAPLK